MGNTFHIRRHIVIRNRSERFGTRSGEFPAKEAWMRLTDGTGEPTGNSFRQNP